MIFESYQSIHVETVGKGRGRAEKKEIELAKGEAEVRTETLPKATGFGEINTKREGKKLTLINILNTARNTIEDYTHQGEIDKSKREKLIMKKRD